MFIDCVDVLYMVLVIYLFFGIVGWVGVIFDLMWDWVDLDCGVINLWFDDVKMWKGCVIVLINCGL